MKVVSRRSYLD